MQSGGAGLFCNYYPLQSSRPFLTGNNLSAGGRVAPTGLPNFPGLYHTDTPLMSYDQSRPQPRDIRVWIWPNCKGQQGTLYLRLATVQSHRDGTQKQVSQGVSPVLIQANYLVSPLTAAHHLRVPIKGHGKVASYFKDSSRYICLIQPCEGHKGPMFFMCQTSSFHSKQQTTSKQSNERANRSRFTPEIY